MTRLDVRFRPRAEADLKDIYLFIAERDGPLRAWSVIEGLQALCESLAGHPRRGKPRDDLAPGIRAIALDRMATIAYRLLPDCVEIVAVAWAGRDVERLWRDE